MASNCECKLNKAIQIFQVGIHKLQKHEKIQCFPVLETQQIQRSAELQTTKIQSTKNLSLRDRTNLYLKV